MRIIELINKKTNKKTNYSSIKLAVENNETLRKDVSKIYYKMSRLKVNFENENFIIKRKKIITK